MEDENVIQKEPETEAVGETQNSEPAKEKDTEFFGQEIEHQTVKEVSKEDVDEIKKISPITIEWKKPFFITFFLAVAAVALTYFLNL